MNNYWIPSHRISREGAVVEHHILLKNGWSPWKKMMVPAVAPNQKDKFLPRSDSHEGFKRSYWPTVFTNYANCCGIYERRAKRNDEVKVVYIGSTCTKKRGSLRTRIRKYCRSGAHKTLYINDALAKGYVLEARLKAAQNKMEAENLENELLDKYDYAWNERRNGIRMILH